MNLANLFKTEYWFNQRTLAFEPATFKIIIVSLIVFLLAAIFLSFRQKKLADKLSQKIAGKLSAFCYSFAIVGMIFVFFRQQELPYLAMRVWLYAWLLACFVWLLFILRYIFVKVPGIRKDKQRKIELERYLPK